MFPGSNNAHSMDSQEKIGLVGHGGRGSIIILYDSPDQPAEAGRNGKCPTEATALGSTTDAESRIY